MLDQPRQSLRYEASVADDEPALINRMLELVGKHPRYGYPLIWALSTMEADESTSTFDLAP